VAMNCQPIEALGRKPAAAKLSDLF